MSELRLPTSCWTMATLGELSEIKSGVGFPKKYQGQNSGDYPVYKVGDVSRSVTQRQGRLNTANYYVTADETVALKGTVFRTGSTLFAKIGEAVKLNRRAFVIRPGLADNNVMAVVPFLHESDRYLHYFLRTVDLSDVSRSTTVPSVRKGDIEELRLPLPPLAEQKVIADKLDTLLAQVETTKARLERIPQILKRFRQSVLAAAVSGVFEDIEYQGELGSVANIVSGIAFKKSQYSVSGSKLLQISNVGYGSTKWEKESFIPMWLADQFSGFSLEAGDIVLALNRPITNDTLKVARIVSSDIPATLYQRVARIRPDESVLESDFLLILMRSNEFRIKVERNLKGSDQPYLNTSTLSAFYISLPSLTKQTEIVRRVEQLFAHADTIEQQVNNALARVNNLTQSILAKAFRGELTEQWRRDNPELISGDNSAAALLARIQAERAATAKSVRRKAKT